MIVKLLAAQIPTFWENIKFAVVRVDEVEKEGQQQYLNELLHALLNDKAQCWIRISNQRNLIALLITRILLDKITAKKYISLQCFYSFEAVSDEVWDTDFKLVTQFALSEQCSFISFSSCNKKIWEVAKRVGFEEKCRAFVFNLRGV